MIKWIMIFVLLMVVPIEAATRLGLHHTQEELDVWRQRMTNGPYRVAGDARTNSPGDWTNITNSANSFLTTFANDRWTGNTLGRCWTQNDGSPQVTHQGAQKIMNASFYGMVAQSTTHKNLVRDELLFHAAQPGLDWTDTSIWCFQSVGVQQFGIHAWLLRMLFAYDFIRDDTAIVSAGQKTTLDTWFSEGGHFWSDVLDWHSESMYVDRYADPQVISPARAENLCTSMLGINESKGIPYFGGPTVRVMSELYGNQRQAMYHFFGHVGIMLEDAYLMARAKQHFKEELRYGFLPDSTPTDFHRFQTTATDVIPTAGYGYSSGIINQAGAIATAFGRRGDFELLNFTTTVSVDQFCGLGGPATEKSLESIITRHMNYTDHTLLRYGTSDATQATNDNYLIDSVDGVTGEERIADVWIATQANVYYQNPYIASVMTRTAPGQNGYLLPQYPANPASGPGHYPWGGVQATYPGLLFMFHNTGVDPFNLSTDTVKPNPPTDFTATMTSSSSITLNCTAPTTKEDTTPLTDLVGYRAQWCQNPSCDLTQTFDFPSCPHVHSNLQPNTLHRYQIAARRAVGTISNYTTPIQEAMTDVAPPISVVGQWLLNETLGSVANDTSGNGHHGAISGTVTWMNPGLYFNGVDTHVRIPRHPNLEPSAITYCWRVIPDGVQPGQYAEMINKTWMNDASPPYLSYGAFLNAGGIGSERLSMSHGASGTANLIHSSGNLIPPSVETHVCIVDNPTGPAPQQRAYVNGNLTNLTASLATAIAYDTAGTPGTTATGDLYLGTNGAGRHAFKGTLRDVQIYPSALPDADIFTLAQGGGDPNFIFFGLECSVGVGGTYTRIANCPSAFPVCFYDDSQVSMGTPRTQALPLQPGLTGVSGIHVASPEDTTKTIGLAVSQQTDIAYVLRFKPEISLSDVRCRPVHADGTPVDQVLTSPPAQVFTGENRLIGTIRGGRFK